MKLSKYEQETIINFNAGKFDVSLNTREQVVMRNLDRPVAAYPDV